MSRRLAAVSCTLMLLPASGAGRAEVSEVEAQLVEHVEAHTGEALVLLERIVNINSGSLHLDGVRAVGSVLGEEFERLGFRSRWVDGSAFDRAGHLVAEWPGEAGASRHRPHLLLIGHLDTVFEPDSPFQRFERLTDNEARGPGVTDMKGGNVVMLFALRALRNLDLLGELRVTVVMTGDEEKSGRPLSLARAALVEAAADADAAIGFEDGDGDPATAVVARRGASSWRLEVLGTPAHSSQIFQPEIGAGAIYEAARILNEFRVELQDEPDLTFNPGVILGGTDVDFDPAQARGTAFGKANVIAETAVVSGDVRALSPHQYERVKARMRAIVANGLPGTEAVVTFSDGYPPLADRPGNRRLLEIYDEVSRDLGLGPVTAVDPRNAGAADVAFVAAAVPMVLDGIGLMGRGGHTTEETADLSTLSTQTQRAAVLLYRLSRLLPED